MRPLIKLSLALFVLSIFMTTMVYSLNAGNIIPFSVNPDETGEHGGDHQFPQIEGTIQVDENQENNLDSLANINQSQAEDLALQYTTGGTVVSSTLDNENGYLVWKVVVRYDGQDYEVLVDAGDGKILWASNQSGEE